MERCASQEFTARERCDGMLEGSRCPRNQRMAVGCTVRIGLPTPLFCCTGPAQECCARRGTMTALPYWNPGAIVRRVRCTTELWRNHEWG